jgi:hypothetical protein
MKKISEVEENRLSRLQIFVQKRDAPPPPHHPISQLIRGYFIQRRRKRYSSLQYFLHGYRD